MICLHAGRWQHTWTRTDDSTEGKWKIMFFSFVYVIKKMVNVAAVQPWRYASECIHNSMVAQLQRLPYTPYTYWEILTKKLCRKFCTQISSSQSEERTMVFTREKWYVQSESRKMFFHVLEKWYVQSEATEVCEFRAKIPAFYCSLQRRFAHIQREKFYSKSFSR